MKATIKIPKGWRRLRADEKHVYGDRALNCQGAKDWLLVRRFFVGMVTGEWPCIRRIARAKKWAPKGYVEITCLHWLENSRSSYDPAFAYSLKGKRGLIGFDTIKDQFDSSDLRFWLRKGAK